jgi:hypothetical protein
MDLIEEYVELSNKKLKFEKLSSCKEKDEENDKTKGIESSIKITEGPNPTIKLLQGRRTKKKNNLFIKAIYKIKLLILYKKQTYMKEMKIYFSLFIIFSLLFLVKADEYLEDKYYFQLYPSFEKDKQFLFHAYTSDSKFLTINSTEGESCSIINNENVNDYPIKGLSSVFSLGNQYLVKTCFGPDKIVEIIKSDDKTFIHKKTRK